MVRQISVEQFRDLRAAGTPLVLVDVRQPEEHAYCALPDDVLIPLDELAGRWSELDVPEGAEVVCYCHHGVRSMHAARFLESVGVAPASSLAGGIDAWSLRIDPEVRRY